MEPSPLDAAVARAQTDLAQQGALQPCALFFLATGLGLLPARLERGRRIPLSAIEGVPAIWREQVLHHGSFNGLPIWMLEDAPLPSLSAEPPSEPTWAEGFPVWLAAVAGASSLIHVTAGCALPRGPSSQAEDADGELRVGSLALVRDHLNLSGCTPLLNLGDSRLGPVFPDQTLLHDVLLRETARALAGRMGFHARTAVAACTLGPSLDTPAELSWFARAGAHVAAQRLATPLLCAAHAGLGVLSIVVVTNSCEEPVDIARIAARSAALAPALDDFLWELAANVQRHARAGLDQDPA
jgi:purine-nucleoside phosphorylase